MPRSRAGPALACAHPTRLLPNATTGPAARSRAASACSRTPRRSRNIRLRPRKSTMPRPCQMGRAGGHVPDELDRLQASRVDGEPFFIDQRMGAQSNGPFRGNGLFRRERADGAALEIQFDPADNFSGRDQVHATRQLTGHIDARVSGWISLISIAQRNSMIVQQHSLVAATERPQSMNELVVGIRFPMDGFASASPP